MKTKKKRERRKLIAKSLTNTGFSVKEIAELLGHKNERMSLHYSAIAKTKLSLPMK